VGLFPGYSVGCFCGTVGWKRLTLHGLKVAPQFHSPKLRVFLKIFNLPGVGNGDASAVVAMVDYEFVIRALRPGNRATSTDRAAPTANQGLACFRSLSLAIAGRKSFVLKIG